MRTTRNCLVRSAGILAAFLLTGCNEPAGPIADTEPPSVCMELGVTLAGSSCPADVRFYVDPSCSSDDRTLAPRLKARWDFEDNGEWDTEFEDLAEMTSISPWPLPVDVWRVRCEVSDASGNRAVGVDSLTIPEWIPSPPDVIVGGLVIRDASGAEVDTVAVNEACSFLVQHREWINEQGIAIGMAVYLDGELVRESSFAPMYPAPNICVSGGGPLSSGSSATGAHEVVVVLDEANEIQETNEDNNVRTKTFWVQ